jgi:nitrogen regulatory protein P-II 1
MKKIEAIIRTSHLERVRVALHQKGIAGMTIYDARGVGCEQGTTLTYRGNQKHEKYVPRVKVEVIVNEEVADIVIDTIYASAYTGNLGDGRIVVTHVDEFIRIRTGECQPERVDVAK